MSFQSSALGKKDQAGSGLQVACVKKDTPLRHAVYQVSIDLIDLEDRRFQVRLDSGFEDLRRSLKAKGLQVPVVLWISPEERRQKPYIVVCGFRRIQAARSLGWRELPALFFEGSETEAFAYAFVENVKRKNLSPLDRAYAVMSLRSRWRLSSESVARLVGISERQARRYERIAELPSGVREALRDGKLSMSHALLLSRLEAEKRKKLLKKVVKEKLSREDLYREIKRLRAKKPKRYMVRTKGGFRLFGFSVSQKTPEREREKIRRVLAEALSLLDGQGSPGRM